jgi:hypothetical protein
MSSQFPQLGFQPNDSSFARRNVALHVIDDVYWQVVGHAIQHGLQKPERTPQIICGIVHPQDVIVSVFPVAIITLDLISKGSSDSAAGWVSRNRMENWKISNASNSKKWWNSNSLQHALTDLKPQAHDTDRAPRNAQRFSHCALLDKLQNINIKQIH